MSAIVELAKAVLWLFRIIAAIISFAFGLASWAAPWRIRALFTQYSECRNIDDFTWSGFALFGVTLFDYITLVAGVFVCCTWRIFSMFADFKKELEEVRSPSKRSMSYRYQLRYCVWENLGEFLTELPFVLMAVLNTVMIWHAPFFWSNMLTFFRAGKKKRDYQEMIFGEMLVALAEFFLIPFGLFVALTCYRIPAVQEGLADVKATPQDLFKRLQNKVERRMVIVQQGMHVVLDLFVLLLSIILIVPFILRFTAVHRRVKKAREDKLRYHKFYHKVRIAVLENIALSFRELVGALAYCVLLPSVYRFYVAISSALEKCGDAADPRPHTEITSVVPELPEEGGGVKLHIKGKKPSDLVFTSAKLYVRDALFWEKLGDVMGSGVALVAKAFLPYNLTPNKGEVAADGKRDTLVAADFKAGETTFETTLFFDIGAKKKTVRKNLEKLGLRTSASFTIEFGDNHDGTLMQLTMTFGDLLDCEEKKKSLPLADTTSGYVVTEGGNYVNCITRLTSADIMKDAKKVQGELFCDVMTMPALIQLGLLLTDVLAILFFVLIHFVPWRAYAMYKNAFSPASIVKKRRALQHVKKLTGLIASKTSNAKILSEKMEEIVDKLGKSVKLNLPSKYSTELRRYWYRYDYNSRLPREYIPATADDTDLIAKIFDAILLYVKLFDDQDEPALAADVTAFLRSLYLRLRAHCIHAIELQRFAQSFITPDQENTYSPFYYNRYSRSNKKEDQTKEFTLFDMCPFLRPIEGQIGGKTVKDDEDFDDDFDIDSNGDPKERPKPIPTLSTGEDYFKSYALLGKSCRIRHDGNNVISWKILPEASSLAANSAYANYKTVRDTETANLENLTKKLTTEAATRLKEDITRNDDATKKWSMDTIKKSVFFEVLNFAQDVAAVLCILFIVATVYRIPALCLSFKRKLPYGEGFRKLCYLGVFEVLLDVTYLLKVILVFAGVRNAFALMADVVEDAVRRRSVASSRQVVDYYAELAILDVISLATFLFTPRAIRWGIGSVAVGILTPGIMLEKSLFPDNKNTPFAGFLIVLACGWLYGIPAYFATTFAEGDFDMAFYGIFGSVIFVMFVGLCLESKRKWEGDVDQAAERDLVAAEAAIQNQELGYYHYKRKGEATRRNPLGVSADEVAHSRFVVFNWFNGTQFIYALLEVVWMVALVAQSVSPNADNTEFVHTVSRYLLLQVNPGDGDSLTSDAGAFPVGVWVSIGGLFVYYMLVALPVVVLAINSSLMVCKHNAWVFLMTFFAYPAQVFIIYNMLSFVFCEKATLLDGKSANYTVLHYNDMVVCYEGDHLKAAIPVLLGVLFYLFTSVIKIQEYSTAKANRMDIVSLDLYELYLRFALAATTVLCVFSRDSVIITFVLVAVCGLWCLWWTLSYQRVFGKRHISVDSFRYFRVFCFALMVTSSFAILICDVAGRGAGGAVFCTAFLLLSVALGYKLYQLAHEVTEELEVTPEQIQGELLNVFEKLKARGEVVAEIRQNGWKRFVKSNVRPSQLAIALMRLEHHATLRGTDIMFLSLRSKWYREVWNLVDPEDVRRDFSDRLYHRNRYYHPFDAVAECLCPCCYDDSFMSYLDFDRQPNSKRDLPKLMELLRRFGNAVLSRGPVEDGDDVPDYVVEDDGEEEEGSIDNVQGAQSSALDAALSFSDRGGDVEEGEEKEGKGEEEEGEEEDEVRSQGDAVTSLLHTDSAHSLRSVKSAGNLSRRSIAGSRVVASPVDDVVSSVGTPLS